LVTTPAPEAAYAKYSDLSEDEQNLYLEIQNMFGHDWNHGQVMEFMEKLDDYNVNTSDNLCDAFMYVADSAYTESGAKAEFAEYWFCEIMEQSEAYDHIVVDWEATYDYALRYDMFFFEFDGDYFFFNSNY